MVVPFSMSAHSHRYSSTDSAVPSKQPEKPAALSERAQSMHISSAPSAWQSREPRQSAGYLAIQEPNLTVAPTSDMDLSMEVEIIAQRRLGHCALLPREHPLGSALEKPRSQPRPSSDLNSRWNSSYGPTSRPGAAGTRPRAEQKQPVRQSQGSILNAANMTIATRNYMMKYGLLDGDEDFEEL